MEGKFLFLGTGGSAGVPMIGCSCSVCLSTTVYNSRLRSAGVVQLGKKNILIDVGPDFREQVLKFQIARPDLVLLTHAHFDHIAGIDDLRAYFLLDNKRIPAFLSQATLLELRKRFDYLFEPPRRGKSLTAQIDFYPLDKEFGKIVFESIPIQYFTYEQGDQKVTGYRFGDFAYVTDIRHYCQKVIEAIQGINTLVVSGSTILPTSMNFSVEEAIFFARAVGAKKTYLTHLSHDLEYTATNALLPEDVKMAYDGMELPIKWGI